MLRGYMATWLHGYMLHVYTTWRGKLNGYMATWLHATHIYNLPREAKGEIVSRQVDLKPDTFKRACE